MVNLLVIYFTALAICTFIPATVSSYPFINLTQSIQFEIDPKSPAMSVEKDFLGAKEKPTKSIQFANLNEVVGKAPAPRVLEMQAVAVVPTKIAKSLAVIDYSQKVRTDAKAQMTVSGPLELKQGLALTDENRIEIHREYKGIIVEYGDVDIEKGTYAIKPTNLEGHICARLRGNRYEIIGEGCYSLDRIKLNKSVAQGPLLSISRYKDVLAFSDKFKEPEPLPMKVAENTKPAAKPESREFRSNSRPQARIIDFYDLDNSEAKALDAIIETSVQNVEDEGSTVITFIKAANHPPARMIASNSTPRGQDYNLPGNKAQKALNEIARDAGMGTDGATVWGRTRREGKPVGGMQVEIEGREDIRPLYLNEFYIPDPNQKSTASHGLYTFVGVPDGEYSVKATLNNQFAGFQNISARGDYLSIAEIDSTERKREVRLAVYDLINKTSQSAVVTLQNYEEDVVVENGQSDINVQDGYDTAYALVNPLNKKYMTAQYILPPGEELYNFPLVSSEWMEQMLSQAKLERGVQNKIVLGIGAHKPYRVEAIGSKTAQIIYFDSEGQILDGNFGSAGGGFLILNPESDVTEFAIQAAGEKSVRSIYMPAISNVLNVIQL